MGMLSGAILQGAAQGLNVLGQGMQRDLDRQDEQAMWEKRTRLLGEIQRENANVQREDEAAFRDKRLPTVLEQERQTVVARSGAQQAADLGRLNNAPLNDAERKKRSDDAAVAEKEQRDTLVRRAGDSEYLKAVGTVKLADPEVKARLDVAKANVAQSYAAAANSSAHAASARVAADQAKRVGGLFTEASNILNDKSLTDDQRTEKYNRVVSQIELFDPKGRKKPGAERDPELDTQTVVEEKMNPDGTTTKTTRKEVRRPGKGGGETADPIKSAMDAQRAAANKTAPAGQRTGMLPPEVVSPSQTARAEYLRELKILEDMKGSMFMPKSKGNEREIAAQEAKVNRLLQAAQSF